MGKLSAGKRKLVVDLYCADATQKRDDRFWIFPGGIAVDLFRYSSYKYWGLLRKNAGKGNSSDLHYVSSQGSAPYKVEFGKARTDNGRLLPRVTQEITLRADRSKFNGAGWTSWWRKYIRGGRYRGRKNKKIKNKTTLPGIIKEGIEYTDHVFDMMLPYDKKELQQMTTVPNPMQIDIQPVYNFYEEQYEEASADNRCPEAAMPNMYIFTSYDDNRLDPAVNEAFEDFITLENQMPEAAKLQGGQIRDKYYDKWSGQILLAMKNGNAAKLAARGTNMALPLSEARKFNHYGEMRSEFPMYVDFSFSTDTSTEFADMLEESKLDVAFLSDVMKETVPEVPNEMQNIETVEMDENPRVVDNLLGGKIIRNFPAVRIYDRKTLDITQWLGKFIQFNEQTREMQLSEDTSDVYMGLRDQLEKFAVFLGATTDREDIITDPKFEPFKKLLIMIFAGKLRKLIKNNFRSFEDMLNGEKAYTETVMYRIAKRNLNGSDIQNFYIPNSSDINIFKFIDTQVKYDKSYEYTVYAYQAVIGTKYSYSDSFVGWREVGQLEDVPRADRNSMARFTVTYEPSVQLVEIPYYTKETLVHDDPPLPPEVEIIPYRGVADRIQVRLNGSAGEHVVDPILIERTDAVPIDRIRKAYALDPEEPIRYSCDDEIRAFEVYRSETQPVSYESMKGMLHTTVITDVSTRTPQRANSATVLDVIRPNRKYYYMFRSIDRHNLISNPSAIYEVELVEENTSVFASIKVVGFAEPVNISSKPMKRYLHIKPSLAHGLIDRDKMDVNRREDGKDIERVLLGVPDEKIWGKKFKLRLTSKSSGKKIDFNLNFVTKHIKPGDG